MGTLDARHERALDGFAEAVRNALGAQLLSIAVYGSAATDDWVAEWSDVNVVIVVQRVTPAVLDALQPVIAATRQVPLALPLIVDPPYLERARDVFAMELDDIRRTHRMLGGADVFAGLQITPAALRMECERDARTQLLRLRARYLQPDTDDEAIRALLVRSLPSVLTLVRHLVHLHGDPAPFTFLSVIVAGERLLGRLPACRAILADRTGTTPMLAAHARRTWATYLEEVERLVTTIDGLHG